MANALTELGKTILHKILSNNPHLLGNSIITHLIDRPYVLKLSTINIEATDVLVSSIIHMVGKAYLCRATYSI